MLTVEVSWVRLLKRIILRIVTSIDSAIQGCKYSFAPLQEIIAAFCYEIVGQEQ